MANPVQPSDAHVRETAVDPSRSFVVSAPAGSGKTGLLTMRVLKLLCVVDKPEEILCITFTRKAALEMHERVFNALKKAANVRNGTSRIESFPDYERSLVTAAIKALERDELSDWKLMSSPHRLVISTIDGLCKQLCNQLPLSSGMGTNLSVVDNPIIEYSAAIHSWLQDAFKVQDASLKLLVEHLVGDLNKLHDLFCQLLAVRDQWFSFVFQQVENRDQLRLQFEQTIQNWVDHSIAQVAPQIKVFEAEFFDIFYYIEKNSDVIPDSVAHILQLGRLAYSGPEAPECWQALLDFCLTKASEPAFRKRLDKRDGFPSTGSKEQKAESKAKKEQALKLFAQLSESVDIEQLANLRGLPSPKFPDSQWLVLDALLDVLPRLAAFLRLRFIESSSADFTEFSLAAANALEIDSGSIELLQRLDYRIRHILIDEFQDTSQTQLELLKGLTREWLPDDGRSLFLVGDGMQSCYSFRNANVGIFLNMKDQGLENIHTDSLELNVNFRSSSTVIDWVNKHFLQAFPKLNDINYGAVKYVPSIAFKPENNDSFVRVQTFSSQKKEARELVGKAEAAFIADEITQTLSLYPNESIAILAKSRGHILEIISELTARKIDYNALEIDALESKPHIRDLISLTRVLTQPAEKLYWLACLRSAFCGLSHSDLFYTFNHEGGSESDEPLSIKERVSLATTSDKISADGKRRLVRFISVYKNYFSSLGRRAIAELVELVWIELGGPEQLAIAAFAKDVERFFTLLSDHEEHGQLNWDSASSAIAKLFAAPISKTSNPVQIMTMHKSKGLEFDTVFLPQLHKPPRADDPELLYWLSRGDANSADFLLSPMARNTSKDTDTLSQFIKDQRTKKSRLEDVRVFYVACTRAKTRLYLTAALQVDDKTSELKAPVRRSLLASLWPTVGQQAHNTFVDNMAATPEAPKASVAAIQAMPLNWRPISVELKETFQREAKLDTSEIFDNTGVNIYEEFLCDSSAADVGIVFHKLMQSLVSVGFLKQFHQAETFLPLLRRLGLERDQETYWASQFADCISALEQNATARWILDSEHEQSECEFELIQQGRSGPKRHVIDRTFVDGDTRWVIDYKTSTPNSGQTIDEFLAEEAEQYRSQLERYRKLMRAYDASSSDLSTVKQLRTGLYFPFIGHFHELDDLALEYQ